MPLKLLPLPPSEYHIYMRIADEAFRPGVCSIMFANGMSQKGIDYGIAKIKRYEQRHPGREHFFKIVDTDLVPKEPFGQAVGIARWKLFPRQRTDEEIKREEEEEEKDEEEYGSHPDVALGTMADFMHEFHRQMDEGRRKHLGNRPYLLLHVLCTRPEHERRGVGSVALAWGAAKADELGLPAYLEGSPKGIPLYKKWGFEIVETMPLDARDYGYHEPLTHMCMLRQPKRQ
jgi:GNAT superfamily N-acetyltransferase